MPTNTIFEPAATTTAVDRSFDPRIWLLALGTFAVGTDSFVVSGILNQVAHNLAIDLDAPGNVVSSYSLAYGPSGPILAALTGRFRKDRVVLMAIALFAVANALCAIAPTYATIITARIVTGLAAVFTRRPPMRSLPRCPRRRNARRRRWPPSRSESRLSSWPASRSAW